VNRLAPKGSSISAGFRALVLGSAIATGACKSGIPADAKTTVLSFEELDCSTCGNDMARALIKTDGVYKTQFDKRKAELTVVAEPNVDVLALAQQNHPKDEEWTLVAGAGKGHYKAWEKAPENTDVVQIAQDGEDVPDLAPHLAQGKITIVDFSAKWCEPCRELDAYVLGLLKKRGDVAYRKLDIGDWDTPLAQRHLVNVKALPYVIVFDAKGQKVASIEGLDAAKLDAAIAKATP
jgi:thiol-disulfide isomerase/thioredoxin